MEKFRSKAIGICAIIWSVLFFAYMYWGTSFLSDIVFNSFFNVTREDYEMMRSGMEVIKSSISLVFLITLIILVVVGIVKCKKDGIKLEKCNFMWFIGGLLLHVIGAIGISWIFILVGGISCLLKEVE